MRIRGAWLAGALLLAPGAALGHDHKADFFAGASFARGSELWGIHETLAIALPDARELSILGDLSIHKGEHEGDDATRIAFMGGIRWTMPATRSHSHLAFGQILAGGAHDHFGAADRTDPSIAIGAGYEFDPDGDDSALAARVQIEYVYVFSGGDGFPRVSGGIVYRVRR
jgi:hypothetical protein